MKKIHVVIWKEDDWYVTKALEVEVASQGRTEEEASANLKEALQLYFEDEQNTEFTNINNPKLQNMTV